MAHVAALARLALSPGEIEAMTRDLEQILAHVASLDALDTRGIAPTLHGFDLPTPLRPDRPAPAMDPELAGRWKHLVARLAKLPPPASRLAEGTPEIVGNVLRISIPSGRALAEARRAKGLPEVQGELRAAFPGFDSVDVVPLAGTATPAEQQKLLQQEVLDDPDCKRIIQKLGAELEGVTSLRDDT